ncbi:hypothetical protein [Halalkalibacter alkalisediminis]|uniref:Uncharacterized protein n=1 Tax=Halalkalibacter alkalisediminis TaxID=935616 RepID=A0ABV6NGW1_9BACI|nr:hypothetical protein [Halalkalibacter alkalisediminis]
MESVTKRLDKMLDYYRQRGVDVDNTLELMRDDDYRREWLDKRYAEALGKCK